MALKGKISKTAFNALEEQVKEHYKPAADGNGYELDIDGELDAIVEIRRAKTNEVEEHKKTKEALATLKEQLETVSKSKETEIATLKSESETAMSALTAQYRQTRHQEVVSKLAAETFGDNVVLGMPHLEKRIEVMLESTKGADGKPVFTEKVRYLGADGKDVQPEDLKKEFLTNKHFAAIVKTSGASGGGPGPSAGGGAPVPKGGPAPAQSFGELRARIHEQVVAEVKQELTP